jgi:hypothetical protein
MKFAVAIIALAISGFAAVAAVAQDVRPCRIVRAEGASFLEQCGNQLRSFSLSLTDIARSADHDIHGRFSFNCPIAPMCAGAPTIGGAFISPENWNRGPKDERAIFDALLQVPRFAASWSGPVGTALPPPSVGCQIIDVSIGDMPGRAVCYNDDDKKGSSVVVVASDVDVGIVLTFHQREQSAADLRDRMLAIVPQFKVQRAAGDAALIRWVR